MSIYDQDAWPLMDNYGVPAATFVRGAGTELWDEDGKRYLDFLAGLATVSLGHANPEVAEAICCQARTLLHTSNLFATEPGPWVARELDRLVGGGGKVLFQNSGAEANECAIKLARKWGGGEHGRWQVISTYGGFHGRTLATLHATGQPAKHEAFQPLPPGFLHVAWQDVAAVEAAIDESVAAVMVEPIQGEGGVLVPPDGYLADLRRLCDEYGVLLIVDEVQTGLGRTGAWFGFQHDSIRPDIVTMAKALGNGVPIGACWARDEVASAFKPGDHGSTFGGQPLAASAARAVLRIMVRDDLPARSARMGELLRERLAAVPGVARVRGRGLLLAAVLEDDLSASEVNRACLGSGLVANAVTQTALRFAPPLTVSEGEIAEAVSILAAAIVGVR